MVAHSTLAFDWDGTCVQHVGDVVFDDPASVQESCIRDREVQKRVLQLLADGHDVHVVTGRSRKVRAVTLAQVRDLSPEIKVHHQERFTGFIALREWKAAKLREIGAQAYVGDHMVDELAAGDAGIPFMHVDEYRKGGDLLALIDQPSGVDSDLDAVEQELRAHGRQNANVQVVVPRNTVARALARPEEHRVAKRRGPAAAVREDTPRAVKRLVGKHKAVLKGLSHAGETTQRRKKLVAKGGR